MGYLEDLYEQYGDRAEFLLVVISEAGHQIPGLESLRNPGDSQTRRWKVAEAIRREGLSIPAVMDTPDLQMEKKYHAWPWRIVGVDRSGHLAFDAPFDGRHGGVNVGDVRKWLDHLDADSTREIH